MTEADRAGVPRRRGRKRWGRFRRSGAPEHGAPQERLSRLGREQQLGLVREPLGHPVPHEDVLDAVGVAGHELIGPAQEDDVTVVGADGRRAGVGEEGQLVDVHLPTAGRSTRGRADQLGSRGLTAER